MKIDNTYELIFITRPDLSEDGILEVMKKLEEILERGKGKILKRENWGLRKLSYNIGKCGDGFYMLLVLECNINTLREVERSLRLNEQILRFMTIRISVKDIEAYKTESTPFKEEVQ